MCDPVVAPLLYIGANMLYKYMTTPAEEPAPEPKREIIEKRIDRVYLPGGRRIEDEYTRETRHRPIQDRYAARKNQPDRFVPIEYDDFARMIGEDCG